MEDLSGKSTHTLGKIRVVNAHPSWPVASLVRTNAICPPSEGDDMLLVEVIPPD